MIYEDVDWEDLLQAAYEWAIERGWPLGLSSDDYFTLASKAEEEDPEANIDVLRMVGDFMTLKAVVEKDDPYDLAQRAAKQKDNIIARFSPWLPFKVKANRERLN